jgi:hypothetical protein
VPFTSLARALGFARGFDMFEDTVAELPVLMHRWKDGSE